jgi:hypothetical protein
VLVVVVVDNVAVEQTLVALVLIIKVMQVDQMQLVTLFQQAVAAVQALLVQMDLVHSRAQAVLEFHHL